MAGDIQPGEDEAPGDLSTSMNTWREAAKKMELGSFLLWPVTRLEEIQTGIQEILTEHQEAFFYCVGKWELAQIV